MTARATSNRTQRGLVSIRGPATPILLPPDRLGLAQEVESRARRLSAHNYFVLSPDLSGRPAEDPREAAEACLDHLADERRVDDTRVGVPGFGSGVGLAMTLTAVRAERVAAVVAYAERGLGLRSATEIASRINCVVGPGYTLGVVPQRLGILDGALCAAVVDFDIEVCLGETDQGDLLDLLARALTGPLRSACAGEARAMTVLNR